ncbi:hypothetical protein [Neobacillus drentensis]|uniref:hypothetical protein n=1 Tax=Neobacillus drentensis TaxID=220684 RepID=UPI00285B5459|nr:hypothetical protein [Neobacillus drentensis]MDR7239662.1 hypothetical protein [Neobacillus drentensis]
MQEGELFKQWLENNKGLKRESAKDVLSRARRVEKIDVNLDVPFEEIIVTLNNNDNFNNINKNVKRQIKRAIKLYKEFIEEYQLVN